MTVAFRLNYGLQQIERGVSVIYLLDTSDIDAIDSLIQYYPIDGVTTNPSIISHAKKPLKDCIKDIRRCIGEERMLHVQPISLLADDMVEESLKLREMVNGNFYAKIPVCQQGIKAIQMLKKEGIQVTATAIFTQQQALIAAKAGADFVAPYVNRLDNISSDGIKVVEDIMRLMSIFKFSTKVLAASFKNVEQIHKVSLTGAHAVTINPELFGNLIYHPLTEKSINDFIADGKPYYNL